MTICSQWSNSIGSGTILGWIAIRINCYLMWHNSQVYKKTIFFGGGPSWAVDSIATFDMISVSLYSRWSHKKVDLKHIENEHACFFCKSRKKQEATLNFLLSCKFGETNLNLDKNLMDGFCLKMVKPGTFWGKWSQTIDSFSICLYCYFSSEKELEYKFHHVL